VTPEQGEQLTAIESLINTEVKQDTIADFEAFTPRVKVEVPPRQSVPVFGRRIRRYSNRL
jgi:hypothetical protein